MIKKIVEILPTFPNKKRWTKIILAVFLFLIGIVFCVSGAAAFYYKMYIGKVYSGVYVGQYHIGNMTANEAITFIENTNNRLAKEGITLKIEAADGRKATFNLNTVSAGADGAEIIKLDSQQLAILAMNSGRAGHWYEKLFLPIIFNFFHKVIDAPLVVDNFNLLESLKSGLSRYADEPRNAQIKIRVLNPLQYDIIPEKNGRTFVYENIARAISEKITNLSFEQIEVKTTAFEPTITAADVVIAVQKLPAIFVYGDIGLNYINPQTQMRRDWIINQNDYSTWLEAQKNENNQPIFVLNKDSVDNYLFTLRAEVDQPVQDAKFTMENGKVKEMQFSQNGLSLNLEKTYQNLNTAFKGRNYGGDDAIKTVGLAVDVVEPKIKLAQINDWGISDVIGAGTSTFHDSHTNRIKNIATAIKRLNGVIIQPGEEFSAIKYAGPFISANGFLPEAVIKGKEIKNEIGGGMCQIGTTLFRMAMNSGMDITQRQNHSLVVGYYADPVNGNPGTDAALYEPTVDVRFINDTGSYLLLQTDINYKKQMLTFTLWGKPDGRKGWFSHPLVKRWISAGKPEMVVTDKLKPGEEKCQAAFRGAVATFTYTRITPSGEKIDRVFDSYYRPLPKICMVGGTCAVGGGCTTSTSGAPLEVVD